MLVEGKKDVFTWEDGWTVATVDHGRCAQFEHTIIIHRDGAEILTCSFCFNKQLSLYGGDDGDGDASSFFSLLHRMTNNWQS